MVLITGATGLIGGAWLRRIAGRGAVVALSRRAGAETLCADLAHPRLGLPAGVYETLTRRVTEVLHCAADVRFTLPLEEARCANVVPVCNLLELARRCRAFSKFAHVSTVFVAGSRSGVIAEERIKPGRFFSTYQQSKWEAEEVVFDAMPGVPAVVYRLSVVLGGANGAVRQLLRLAGRNPLPAIPVDPAARLDLITPDWAAAALDTLHTQAFERGTVRHVCAGEERSIGVADLIGMADPQPRPRLLAPAEFAGAADSWNGTAAGEWWRVLKTILPHLGIRQYFENGRTLTELERAGVVLPDMREVFRRYAESARHY